MAQLKEKPEVNTDLEDFLFSFLYPLENYIRLLDDSDNDENLRQALVMWALIHDLRGMISELCGLLESKHGEIKIVSRYDPEKGKNDLAGVSFKRAKGGSQ